METRLSINLNKVALLRNQRDVGYPSVVAAARHVLAAGARGVTVHPRPDRRHIRPSDVRDLAALLRSEYADADADADATVELNIEGNPTGEFLALIDEVVPDQVTLVPDDPDQKTSDHGWDLGRDGERLAGIVERLSGAGVRVSLFMDPDPEPMRLAKACGAHRVELYTESYARAFAEGDHARTLDRFVATAEAALGEGLGINAGHDLNLDNLPAFKDRVPQLAEVSIGHAFTADALERGYRAAVAAYLAALQAT